MVEGPGLVASARRAGVLGDTCTAAEGPWVLRGVG